MRFNLQMPSVLVLCLVFITTACDQKQVDPQTTIEDLNQRLLRVEEELAVKKCEELRNNWPDDLPRETGMRFSRMKGTVPQAHLDFWEQIKEARANLKEIRAKLDSDSK